MPSHPIPSHRRSNTTTFFLGLRGQIRACGFVPPRNPVPAEESSFFRPLSSSIDSNMFPHFFFYLDALSNGGISNGRIGRYSTGPRSDLPHQRPSDVGTSAGVSVTLTQAEVQDALPMRLHKAARGGACVQRGKLGIPYLPCVPILIHHFVHFSLS